MAHSVYAPRGLPRSLRRKPPGPSLAERGPGPYSLAVGDPYSPAAGGRAVGERQRATAPEECPKCEARRIMGRGRLRPGEWIWRLSHDFRWYACGTVVDEKGKVLKRTWRCRLRAFLVGV